MHHPIPPPHAGQSETEADIRARAAQHAAARRELGESWDKDPDKPWFHVMPREGWLNDPNGPIFYKGRYHM